MFFKQRGASAFTRGLSAFGREAFELETGRDETADDVGDRVRIS